MSPHLTPRQQQIAELIAAGLTNAQIARQLCLRENTVKNHVSDLYLALGISPTANPRVMLTRLVLGVDRTEDAA